MGITSQRTKQRMKSSPSNVTAAPLKLFKFVPNLQKMGMMPLYETTGIIQT